MSDEKKTITTASGRPLADIQNSVSVGARGPLLLQDVILHERMAHFNREMIPERVVHAKGSGAFGTFTVTHDISKYTKAKIFNQIGKKTRMFLRFSTVGGEKGSADTERDPRGFALKFYTEDGNWDLVGNNTPVFFIKDPQKFSDFIHTQKRDPQTNTKSPTMMWDFWSLNPESMHQIMILFSDRGTPHGYRHMHGFGSHTFSLINADNERHFVKFHFKTQQGIQNFNNDGAVKMKGEDPDFAQRDLFEAIENGNFPRWNMRIQVMTEAQAATYLINPFDLTKVWPHGDFPLIDAGTIELNENVVNFHAEVEQSAFAPSHIVDGIGFSPDKMLQGRLLSYPDAHRYRLGVNYEQLPINRCPYATQNYQRDGLMALANNGGSGPNYFPNSFDGPTTDPGYAEPAYELSGIVDRHDRNAPGEDDHFTQPGNLFRLMDEQNQQNTIKNFAGAMNGISGPLRVSIIKRQLKHFMKTDMKLAKGIADILGFSLED